MPDPLPFVRSLLLLSAAGTLVLGWLAWRRRGKAPAALPFALLAAACALYAAGHAMELGAATVRGIRGWLHVQYLGIPWIPALWMMVALAYTGRPWRTPGRLAALLALPLATFLVHHTDAWHHLFYRAISLYRSGDAGILLVDFGPFRGLHLAYAHASLVMGAVLLVRHAAGAGRGYQRRQTLAVLAGSLLPWLALSLHQWGWQPRNIDLASFGLSFACLFFGYGILRLQVFDLRPVAREQVFLGMRDGVVVADGLGTLLDFNPAARRIFPDLERGGHVRQAFAPWPDLVRALLGDLPVKRLFLPTADGLKRYQVNLFRVEGRGGEGGWAAVLADQTEVYRAMEELRHLATTDPLTGASNRRHFQEHLEQAHQRSARSGAPLCVVAIDLDHFKRVNDTLGHAAGDAVLQVSVARMYACLRDMDTLGRLGGEEFAVILEGSDLARGLRVAERIRIRVSRTPVEWRGEPIAITTSLGVAEHAGGRGGDAQELLRRADMALYRAKAEGRNRVCG